MSDGYGINIPAGFQVVDDLGRAGTKMEGVYTQYTVDVPNAMRDWEDPVKNEFISSKSLIDQDMAEFRSKLATAQSTLQQVIEEYLAAQKKGAGVFAR